MQPHLLVRHRQLAPRISLQLLRRHFLQKLELTRLAALRALNANAGKDADFFDGGSRGRQLAGLYRLGADLLRLLDQALARDGATFSGNRCYFPLPFEGFGLTLEPLVGPIRFGLGFCKVMAR